MIYDYKEIQINKPLSRNYLAIRDKSVNEAIKNKQQLRITTPYGVAMADPKWWKKTGKVIEKVFLIPDNPMVLYANVVKYEEPKTKEELEKEEYLKFCV